MYILNQGKYSGGIDQPDFRSVCYKINPDILNERPLVRIVGGTTWYARKEDQLIELKCCT